jgi:cytochrome c
MKTSGVVWDEEAIDKYIADPRGFIKGNRMAFPGLKRPEDRQNVIAYIKEATK